MREVSANSSWARAPDRDNYIGRPLSTVPNPTDVKIDGLFSPRLESSPTLRGKVHSSGYGKELPKPIAPMIVDEEELKEAEPTFQPDLELKGLPGAKSRQQFRSKVASSGYGKQAVPAKGKPTVESPTFKPNMGKGSSAKLKSKAQSSGYGRVVAPARSQSKLDKPSFTPNLNVSKYSAKLRAKAVDKTYLLPGRPRTAPATLVGQYANTLHTPRHTLASDRGDTVTNYDQEEDDLPPFVLDGGGLHQTPRPLPTPEKITRLIAAMRLKESASSSGYGTDEYHPPCVELQLKDPQPLMLFGQPQPLSMEELAAARVPKGATATKLAQSVPSNYGEGYTPAHMPMRQIESSPRWKPVMNAVRNFRVEELASVQKSRLNDSISSSCYGIATPAFTPRPEPVKKEPRLLMGTATTTLLSVEKLPIARPNHRPRSESLSSGASSDGEDDDQADERVTHFPL